MGFCFGCIIYSVLFGFLFALSRRCISKGKMARSFLGTGSLGEWKWKWCYLLFFLPACNFCVAVFCGQVSVFVFRFSSLNIRSAECFCLRSLHFLLRIFLSWDFYTSELLDWFFFLFWCIPTVIYFILNYVLKVFSQIFCFWEISCVFPFKTYVHDIFWLKISPLMVFCLWKFSASDFLFSFFFRYTKFSFRKISFNIAKRPLLYDSLLGQLEQQVLTTVHLLLFIIKAFLYCQCLLKLL